VDDMVSEIFLQPLSCRGVWLAGADGNEFSALLLLRFFAHDPPLASFHVFLLYPGVVGCPRSFVGRSELSSQQCSRERAGVKGSRVREWLISIAFSSSASSR